MDSFILYFYGILILISFKNVLYKKNVEYLLENRNSFDDFCFFKFFKVHFAYYSYKHNTCLF